MPDNLLNSDISIIKGIGEKKQSRLNYMGIYTVSDLLNHLPYRYKDRRNVIPVVDCSEDRPSLISGKLSKITSRLISGNRTILECVFHDESCAFGASFFNMPYLKQSLAVGKVYALYGLMKIRNGYRLFTNPEICELNSDKDIRGLIPVYRCTNGITNNDFNKWIRFCLEHGMAEYEWIDEGIIEAAAVCGRAFAYRNIHFPVDKKHYQAARYRIIYEQLLMYQLALRLNKKKNETESGDSSISDIDISEFINGLPFRLTEGQSECIKDLENDLLRIAPMNRLVQGDVGCGKTVVAEAVMYKCAIGGYQSAMMAPTEILARQHYNRLKYDFEKYDIKVALLISGMRVSERNEILNELKEGIIDIIVGTHALLQDDVVFNNLSLVITDEQHRFGVNQRKNLVNKGRSVNVCVMSATPIPRTLAATVFGDMDFSIIKTKPQQRKEIITRALNSESRERAYTAAEEEMNKGYQVYVVAPSIDSADADLSSVETLYAELKKRYKNRKLALIHGRMSKDEKELIMTSFSAGEIDLLVATVVIEVGIDVPNASIIIIENSERFGLAQLHQLRGRVGRGNIQSYCYIINYSKSENALLRSRALVEISDGFELSEEDYRLRGPGDIMGTSQSGNYNSGIIALSNYTEILDVAVKDADRILAEPGDTDLNFVKNYMLNTTCSDNSNII